MRNGLLPQSYAEVTGPPGYAGATVPLNGPGVSAMVKIVDVARRAGVSTATVSRVLNGMPVTESLREAVLVAADELGYEPNRSARSLRRGLSELVALILPDIENPYFTSLARGVEDVAQHAGLSVVLCNSDEDPRKERQYLAIAASERMAGVILAPSTSHPEFGRLTDGRAAVVVVDREIEARVDHVLFDNRTAGEQVTEALLDQGFTRIAVIGGPEGISTADERVAGWQSALQRRGVAADPALVRRLPFDVAGGRRAMTDLLRISPPPDAVVASNNLVGVGVLQVLADASIPLREFGVAVIGDLPFSTGPSQSITNLPLLPRQMGVAAAELLVQRLREPDAPIRRVVQPLAMIHRPEGLGRLVSAGE